MEHDRSQVGEFKMRCIVCRCELDSAFHNGGEGPFQPYAGTAFYTAGHYGSTVFDPCDNTRLEVFVCDKCLRELSHLCVHHTKSDGVIKYNYWSADDVEA